MADKLNLLKTGGTDFHGKRKRNIHLGEIFVPYFYLAKLKRAQLNHYPKDP